MKKRKLDILYEDKHLIIVNKNGNMQLLNVITIKIVYIVKYLIIYIKRIKKYL